MRWAVREGVDAAHTAQDTSSFKSLVIAAMGQSQGSLQTNYGVREAPEPGSQTAWKNVAVSVEETTALESLRRKRSTKNRLLVHNVKKLAATDATAKNPMQATDATATPTDVLLGFVMRTLLVVIAVKTYNVVTNNNCQ